MSKNTVAGHIGREYTTAEEVLGRKWKFSRWTRRVWVEFAEFAKRELPDPLLVALDAIEKASLKDAEILRELSKRDAAEMVKAAAERRPPVLVLQGWKPISDTITNKAQELAGCYLDFSSAQFRSLLTSPVGASYAMYLLLKEHQPDVTPDLAYDVLAALGQTAMQEIFATVQGQAPSPSKNVGSPAA